MLESEMADSGLSRITELPTSAVDDSPACRLKNAVFNAVRLEEQAVSMVRLGPRRSYTYETLFAKSASALPVASNIGRLSISWPICDRYSALLPPTKTPILVPAMQGRERPAFSSAS